MKLVTTDAIATVATILGWEHQDGAYQLAAWIEIWRYLTWLGFDTSEHIVAYEAQCKAVKPDGWEFPYHSIDDHRAIMDRLDATLAPVDSYRVAFEALYARVYKALVAPVDALQGKAIVIDGDKLGMVMGDTVQILHAKPACGINPPAWVCMPDSADYRLATRSDFDTYRVHYIDGSTDG